MKDVSQHRQDHLRSDLVRHLDLSYGALLGVTRPGQERVEAPIITKAEDGSSLTVEIDGVEFTLVPFSQPTWTSRVEFLPLVVVATYGHHSEHWLVSKPGEPEA
jgi:hypothetical protein